jgi:hypothetical protein
MRNQYPGRQYAIVQTMLRRWQRFKAESFASTTEKLRPQARERRPTALHTNAEASDEASASSAVANASENKTLRITPLLTRYRNSISITKSQIHQLETAVN